VKPANTGKKQEIQRDEKGRFIPGVSGNPTGPEPGYKQFDTIFEQAIKRIVKEKKLPVKDPEIDMVIKGVVEALKGNYNYFRDFMDRRYGKPTQPIDMKAEIEEKQIRELVLTTRKLLEINVLQPDNLQSGQGQIPEREGGAVSADPGAE